MAAVTAAGPEAAGRWGLLGLPGSAVQTRTVNGAGGYSRGLERQQDMRQTRRNAKHY